MPALAQDRVVITCQNADQPGNEDEYWWPMSLLGLSARAGQALLAAPPLLDGALAASSWVGGAFFAWFLQCRTHDTDWGWRGQQLQAGCALPWK